MAVNNYIFKYRSGNRQASILFIRKLKIGFYRRHTKPANAIWSHHYHIFILNLKQTLFEQIYLFKQN